MIRFSIKNLSTTDLLLIGVLFISLPATAAKYKLEMNFDARYGIHTVGPPDLATHRHTLEVIQSASFGSKWTTLFGGRAESESAYASNPQRYGSTDLSRTDSQTFLLRENFIQYKDDNFRWKFGYQQVVWGEAFGSYYADIVNPKDLREAGLGELSRNRLASPMVNLQWIGSSSSFQLLYLPIPMTHLLPSQGSDFNSLLSSEIDPSLAITIEKDIKDKPKRGEYGFRVTQQISNYDLSVFYLNYFDRMPIYSLQPGPTALSFIARPESKPLQTTGGTLTTDFSGFLLRTELLQHLNREINTYEASTFGTQKTNEFVYVVGLDFPPLEGWNFGVQLSESHLRHGAWAFRDARQSLISGRIAKTSQKGIAFEALNSYFLSDMSNLAQVKLMYPIDDQIEFSIATDHFSGKLDSELGKFKNASRAWVMIKAFMRK